MTTYSIQSATATGTSRSEFARELAKEITAEMDYGIMSDIRTAAASSTNRRGYNGSSYVDSGYFYAPYIPMVVLDLVQYTSGRVVTKHRPMNIRCEILESDLAV